MVSTKTKVIASLVVGTVVVSATIVAKLKLRFFKRVSVPGNGRTYPLKHFRNSLKDAHIAKANGVVDHPVIIVGSGTMWNLLKYMDIAEKNPSLRRFFGCHNLHSLVYLPNQEPFNSRLKRATLMIPDNFENLGGVFQIQFAEMITYCMRNPNLTILNVIKTQPTIEPQSWESIHLFNLSKLVSTNIKSPTQRAEWVDVMVRVGDALITNPTIIYLQGKYCAEIVGESKATGELEVDFTKDQWWVIMGVVNRFLTTNKES